MTNAGCEGRGAPAASEGKCSYLNVFNSSVLCYYADLIFFLSAIPKGENDKMICISIFRRRPKRSPAVSGSPAVSRPPTALPLVTNSVSDFHEQDFPPTTREASLTSFKYLGVLLQSEVKLSCEMDRQTDAVSAVPLAMGRIVAVMRRSNSQLRS